MHRPPAAPRAAWQNPDDKSEDVFLLGTLVSTDTDKEVSQVRIKAGGAEVQVRATDGRAWVAARVVHTTAVDGGGARLKTTLAWEAAAPPGLPAELALERYAGPNWRVD